MKSRKRGRRLMKADEEEERKLDHEVAVPWGLKEPVQLGASGFTEDT